MAKAKAPHRAETPKAFTPGAVGARRAGDDACARFAPSTYNATSHTVDAVFSVGARVRRFGGIEELAITPEAIDLRRVTLGQVRLLDTHNQSAVAAILGVVETAHISNGQLVGRIRFADTDAGRAAEGMVARGELTGVSVGYRVTAWTLVATENETDIWRADKWELHEVSLCAVPADPHASIRSTPNSRLNQLEGGPMDPEDTVTDPNTRTIPPGGAPSIAPAAQMSDRHAREAYDLVARAGLPAEFARTRIDAGETVEQIRSAVFDDMASRANATRTGTAPSDQTLDNPQFFGRAIEDALVSRMTGSPPEGAAREFAGRSLIEIGEYMLRRNGVRMSMYNREAVVDGMLGRDLGGLHTTTDFPVALMGAGQRVLMGAYQALETPLKKLARRRDVADFRPVTLLRLSEISELQKVGESGELKNVSRGEAKEAFAIDTYGGIFGLSRKAVINDDLDTFGQSVRDMARKSADKEAALMVALLTANSGNGINLDDGQPVYRTERGNKANAGSIIDVTNLGLARKALREMKGLDGKTPVNVTPKHLVVGPAKETEAEQVLAQIAAAQVGDANPFSGKLSLHVEPRLTGNAWRLFADPGEISTLVIAYLRGQTGPQVTMQEGWRTLGVEFRVVFDFGCTIDDWRGTYLNPGN